MADDTVAASTEKTLLDVLDQGVRDVLANDKASAAEKVNAINAGTKLLQIKHKINLGDDDGSFFGGRR